MKNITAIALLAAVATTASANIVLNAGFEAGSGADAADWAEILGGPSGTVGRSMAMPNSGSYSAYMSFDHINNPAAGGAYFIEQNQPVGSITALESYDLSFFAKVDSTNFVGMDTFVQILWLDQDGSNGGGVRGEQLTSLIGLGITDSFQQFSLNGLVAAEGADSFLLRFQLSAGAVTDIANGLYVDDVSLTQVPAPASAALLGLGGLVATRRRR
ncbi:MAG: PEP-CTERM sorting domain-containing protein [Phycisphaerales bacterium]|nr:PEP-CTERM sorting domain-containing protein [Phycisphaerales bacterium]